MQTHCLFNLNTVTHTQLHSLPTLHLPTTETHNDTQEQFKGKLDGIFRTTILRLVLYLP